MYRAIYYLYECPEYWPSLESAMNLRSVDLNLLVALNALLMDLHVTRAAERIGLSQPAMSNALSRLRHIFKDELLVRTANGMQATPRAIELAEPVKRLLRQVERILDSESAFDPATTTRSFSVRLSDLLSRLLLPAVYRTLETTAPFAQLDVVHYSPTQTVEALEKDEIDLAISMGLAHSNSIKSVVAMKDRMVCVMHEGHPAAQQPLTMETFLQATHLKVSMSPTDLRFVDDVLARQGMTRRVAVNVPHWLLVPHVLRDRTSSRSCRAASRSRWSRKTSRYGIFRSLRSRSNGRCTGTAGTTPVRS
ncbi:LysR substrate-binding domain-containing protein [Bradyrhizobium sp. RDT10]